MFLVDILFKLYIIIPFVISILLIIALIKFIKSNKNK